ncbi:helix-turn-helix domain-containing protein, partial [Pseudofrankia saprophytica]
MAALNVRELGDYIRDQRRTAQISLRQLAKQAGVSNPYLSQIERGLRKPSAEILQQIAKALRISAEVLYVQAGILEEREGGENLHAAVLADEFLTPRQKQVILDIYDAFRRENAVAAAAAADDGAGETSGVAVEEPGTAAETPGSRPPTTDGAEAAEAAAPGTRAIPKPAAAEAAAPAAGRTTTTGRPRRASASSGTPAAAARTTGRRPRATATGETAAAKPARRAATRR